MSTFDSTKTPLSELLKSIECGRIQLPDFQRGWVWDDEHILSLLVSIARAFPVGAVMLLENGGESRFKVRPVEGIPFEKVAHAPVEKLILDGQQRLTSLTQVLMLQGAVKTRDQKKRAMDRYYYIDIAKALEGQTSYQEAFFSVDKDKTVRSNFGRDIILDLRTKEAEYQNFCFPCNQIFSWSEWLQGISQHNPERLNDFLQFQREVIRAFETYLVPIISLTNETSKEAVCLVFEKVNTGGIPLSVFELITAVYAADGINLRDEWYGNKKEQITGIHNHLSVQKMLAQLEPTEFFQGLSLLHTYTQRQRDLAAGKTGKQATGVSAKRETVLSLPLSAYEQWKEPLREGFWKAAKFLRKESFFNPRDLPYRTQLVPLAAILTLLGDRWLEQRIYDKLARWYWCGVLGELYGGAVETRIALDLQEFMTWLENDEELPATVRDANFQPGRLDTLRSRNSAAYKGISILIQRNGAQDWFWKTTIRELDENDWEESNLDIHHIFPRDWCEKHGIESRRFNSILNKTPISYKANRMIGGKAPSEYLAQLQNHSSVVLDQNGMDALLKTHVLDTASLRANDYTRFVEARRELMLELITNAMGKPPIVDDEPVPEDDVEDLPIQAIDDDADDEEDEAGESDNGKWERRILLVKEQLIPRLQELGVNYKVTKNRRGVIVRLGEYKLRIGGREGNRFTLNVLSKTKSNKETFVDFPGTTLPDFRSDKSAEDREKKAVMSLVPVDTVIDSVRFYLEKQGRL